MSASAAVPIRIREAKIPMTGSKPVFRRKALRDEPPAMQLGAVAHAVSAVAVELNESQREKLLIEHLPQVRYIARRIHDRLPPQILLEDVIHAGILALMDAVRKYDPGKNVQLKYYAESRIRGAILDGLRQADWSPRVLRRQGRRLEQAILECKARLGRDPGGTEIAAELNMNLEELQGLLGDLRGLDIGSLQCDSADASYKEAIQIPTGMDVDPYHQALRSERTALLEKSIGELPPRQRQIHALYHFKELTMKEIGETLGIGESRVSQIHTATLLRLRTHLHDLLNEKPRSANGALPVSATAQRAEEGTLWRRSF